MQIVVAEVYNNRYNLAVAVRSTISPVKHNAFKRPTLLGPFTLKKGHRHTDATVGPLRACFSCGAPILKITKKQPNKCQAW